MSSKKTVSLEHSELNTFLFSEVGIEANGEALSVVSMLARRGKDPWGEAAGLAALAAPVAVERLARMIATMPATLWSLPAATLIASRLVAELPPRSTVAATAVPGGIFSRASQSPWIVIAVGLMLTLGVLATQ
jgi:hypothetical protein